MEALKSSGDYQNAIILFSRIDDDEFSLIFYQKICNGNRMWTNNPEFSSYEIPIQKKPGSFKRK